MYVTIFILIAVAIFFVIREKTIINPIVIFSGIWAVSLFLASLGLYDMIKVTDKAKTIICLGVLSFVIGAKYIKRLLEKEHISWELIWNMLHFVMK